MSYQKAGTGAKKPAALIGQVFLTFTESSSENSNFHFKLDYNLAAKIKTMLDSSSNFPENVQGKSKESENVREKLINIGLRMIVGNPSKKIHLVLDAKVVRGLRHHQSSSESGRKRRGNRLSRKKASES